MVEIVGIVVVDERRDLMVVIHGISLLENIHFTTGLSHRWTK